MTLGETLRLGYLECAPFGDPTPRRPEATTPTSVIEKAEVFGGTIKLNDAEVAKGKHTQGYAKQEAPVQPLEWTHPPVREVRSDGNSRYQVSKAVSSSRRDHKHHLVQTTRIEPQPAAGTSRPSSRSSSNKPSSQRRASEEIVVKESDFKRCGNRLTLLRQCQLTKLPPQSPEECKNELELSFKSAFRHRCHSQDHEVRDPWKDYGNPELYRPSYEGDLVLNQVLPEYLPCERSPTQLSDRDDDEMTILDSARSFESTRAGSVDVARTRSRTSRERTLMKPEGYPQERKSSRRRTSDKAEGRSQERRSSRRPPRARSQGAISADSAVTLQPLALRAREGRQGSHASGCPRPDSGALSTKTAECTSRIQLIDDQGAEGAEECGSAEVREFTRKQQRFAHELPEDCEHNMKEQALWLSLDPLTGDVSLFPRAAATRLEAAHVNNRTKVPLAGLGHGLEDDIVHMPLKHNNDHPIQKSLHGGQRDVRRLMVRINAAQVSINVVWEHGWRIVEVAIPGTTEERIVALNGTETVRPPTPPLPPVNPDRRLSVSCLRQWWDE